MGGSYDWLTVMAGEQVIEIPPFPISAQAEAADRLQALVVALVPAATWETLHAQREQYVADHGG